MLIGISGKVNAGKDAVGQILKEYLGGEIKKFKTKLVEVCSLLTGIPIETWEDREFKNRQLPGWNMTAREFMQKLGTDAIRNNLNEDTWVLALLNSYPYTWAHQPTWIVTDVRFPNEFALIKQKGGIVMRVSRPNQEKLDHISETALDDYKFDHYINNDTDLFELKYKVARILKQLNLINDHRSTKDSTPA